MDVAFRLDLAHGHCVGVAIPEAVDDETWAALPAEERAAAERFGGPRRAGWVAGRVALRAALADLGIEAGPLLSTPRGGPLLPPGALGSISHKQALAVALAAPRAPNQAIGIDLELDAPLRVDISRRVLTAAELRGVDGSDREVLLRVSLKEAIYKALDPFVSRYVSFQEVELEIHADQTATATLSLAHKEGPFTVEARWQDLAPSFLLTTAVVSRAASAAPR